jgi:hypothetical protein
MSPVYLGGTKLNTLYVGGTKINKAYVGNTLVYSSEFIGTVTVTTVIRYAGILVTDTACVPAGAEVAMVASISGTATDATFAWTRPAGSSAPVAGLTTGTLSWTAVAGDGGTYGVTVSSRNSSDSTQSAQETINIFSYVAPGFADADANNWIINVELRDCGQLETGVRNAMNQLVVDLKTSGYYANSNVIHPLIGPRNARSLVSIKGSGYSIDGGQYDRQKGLYTAQGASTSSAPEKKYAIAGHVGLAAAINAGAAGLATFSTECGDSGGACFAQDGWPSFEPANAVLQGVPGGAGTGTYLTGTGQSVNQIFGAVTTGFNFLGGQINGPANARVIKTRVNATLASATYTTKTPSPQTREGLGCWVGETAGPRSAAYFVRHAFLIAGGGASDYSADALRLIIEAYVTAVQAAIPG